MGHQFYIKNSYCGLVYVGNVLKGNQFKTYEQILNDYGNWLTWLEYKQIISAIPREWKLTLCTRANDQTQVDSMFEQLAKLDKPVNKIYSLINGRNLAYKSMFQKVEWQWGIEIEEFHNAFKDLYAITSITKYRNFQYKRY